MIHPSYVDLMQVVNKGVEEGETPVINSRYSIVMATAKRARQIVDGDEPLIDAADGDKPLSVAVEELNQEKIRILADGETIEDVREALSYIDYFFPNYDEAAVLTGKTDIDEIADVLLTCGVKNVILKIGKRGCLVKNAKERFITPAYPKATVVDTTGAGDNFASGFLSFLMEGKKLREASQFANCAASLAIEKIGATAGITSREQADERYAEYLRSLNAD